MRGAPGKPPQTTKTIADGVNDVCPGPTFDARSWLHPGSVPSESGCAAGSGRATCPGSAVPEPVAPCKTPADASRSRNLCCSEPAAENPDNTLPQADIRKPVRLETADIAGPGRGRQRVTSGWPWTRFSSFHPRHRQMRWYRDICSNTAACHGFAYHQSRAGRDPTRRQSRTLCRRAIQLPRTRVRRTRRPGHVHLCGDRRRYC